jgi:Uma2 family endonuclease
VKGVRNVARIPAGQPQEIPRTLVPLLRYDAGRRASGGIGVTVTEHREALVMTAVPEILAVTARASGVAGPAQGCWTYEDYAALPADGNRYEIIDGVLYVTPAPNTAHQAAVTLLTMFSTSYVQLTKMGVVFVSPYDVPLSTDSDTVQPDILVVLNEHRERITPSRLEGAPDLVVEVSSPSTATYDRREKMDAYARAGVPEYWLVDPIAERVELLHFEKGAYVSAGVYGGGAALPSRVLPAFPVEVERFFR